VAPDESAGAATDSEAEVSAGAGAAEDGSGATPSVDRWAEVLGPDGTVQVDRSVHRLRPASDAPTIDTVVDKVLAAPSYTVGDWFAFPDPVLLVHDRERGATFRLVTRGDLIELHLLPGTDASAADAFQERCQAVTDEDWSIERVDG